MRLAASWLLVIGLVAGGAFAQTPATGVHNPDMSPFVAEVDADHDGRMTHAEWAAAGAPESAFNSLDPTHRGYVTLHDMTVVPAPPGIDLNGDGKVTLEEFREFDRRHSQAQTPKHP